MARLRVVNPTSDPTILPPPTKARTTRSSPRKTPSESPSRRELRYTSSQENEDSILIPKAKESTGETPRKQRVLRPVASNSRLLRKLSDESLASPERRERRLVEREFGLGSLYSRNLARTVAKKRNERGMEKQEKLIEGLSRLEIEMETASKVEEEEEEGIERSVLCGDKEKSEEEDEPKVQQQELVHEDDEEDEDEEPVVDVRNRRRQMQPPRHYHIYDEDSDKENEEEVFEVKSQHQAFLAQSAAPEPVEEMPLPVRSMRPPHRKGHSTISNWAQEVVDLTSSPEAPASFVLPVSQRYESVPASPRPTTSSSSGMAAILQYSPTPTKNRSPRKAPPISRPNTPPLPPASPSKLVSPSKKKNRIPAAPGLRPSLDAFWSADVVNTWHDKHSPSKPLLSPRKQKWFSEIQQIEDASDSDASFSSPTTSPRKKKAPIASPSKKTSNDSSPTVAQLRAQRKAFSTTKQELAESFLTQVDQTITGGVIARLSGPTGGIKLVWSRTLKTTAGRANWRREQLRLRTGPLPTDVRVEYRHHCSIELAEKVIDDEERLYNVLAHEYCHLTTFMISEVRNNPHGKEFKEWATKVSRAFQHKGVEVTTKHSYQIAYKYVWECIGCGYEFKRHSKSVDPVRHSCGKCQGRLVQTKPAPRGAANAGGKPREKSEYQVFVKENFSRVKKRLEAEGKDAQMGKVMAAVAEEYKAQRGKKQESVVKVEELFEGLKIEDEDV